MLVETRDQPTVQFKVRRHYLEALKRWEQCLGLLGETRNQSMIV